MKNKNRTFLIVAVAAFCAATQGARTAWANNLAVTNVQLVNKSTWSYDVSFNISWDNSWYTSGAPSATANWDAAWVFVKFSTRTAGSTTLGPWNHASLLGSGDTIPSGAQEAYGQTPYPSGVNKGVFLYRNAPGSGSNSWTGTALRWNFGADNVSSTTVMAVQVFAIEMVYVSSGSFYVGSGGTGTSEFYQYPTPANPYPVNSEAAITVGTTNGNLYYSSGTNQGDWSTPIPAAFPKGFNAFYIMKSDISQRQYCDFLNTLTATQSGNRVSNNFNSYRNWIKKASNGKYGTDANNNAGAWGSANYALMNESTDGGWTAANYLEWADVAAYADWAALRPYTELEYEKAARGGQLPTPNEYAWGSTVIQEASGTVANAGTSTEGPSNASANCVVGNDGNAVQGPMRSGCMAGAATTRVQAGAGYSGALDLSGNVWQYVISAGLSTGFVFDGQHGDGYLDSSGNANTPNWPNNGTAVGSGFRGGVWNSGSGYARVSDRGNAAYAGNDRYSIYGGRCARTSP
jgi:hypothetical protein